MTNHDAVQPNEIVIPRLMPEHLIESRQPFSQSRIWELQKGFFTKTGINAWQSGQVPHYITSNAMVGRTYAELVLAMLRDLAVQGKNEETVYIIELGAGHGRLAYHFLKHYERYHNKSAIKFPPVCYVLSDFVDSNLNFWKTHPRLQPFIEKGWLDCTLFNAESDREFRLSHSGKLITTKCLNQPVIVIANYFFDTIPQELFKFQKHKIERALLTISSELDAANASSAELINSLSLEYSYERVGDSVYLDEPLLNDLLKFYSEHIVDSHVLFPYIGIQCIERLRSLSTNGLMLLSADKGEHHLSNLDNQKAPELIRHGSFSLNVNYHALKKYCENQGGTALFPLHQHSNLDLGCMLWIEGASSFVETRCAFDKFVQDFGPDDFFSMRKMAEKSIGLSYREIASLTRLSGYDAGMFGQLLPTLHTLLPSLTNNERWNLLLMIPRIWDTYFPIQEAEDLACDLGNLLLNLRFYKEAILYFEKSIMIYGKTAKALHGIALCHCLMGDIIVAIPILKKLLEMDSNDDVVQELVEVFQIKMPL